MPTNTFDKRIVIADEESVKKLEQILLSDAPTRKLSKPIYSDGERKRSEKLLAQHFSFAKDDA